MKKTILTSILALLISAGWTIKAQDRADDYLGLPGDNLNLYAVMNLFQESKTLEDFERNLNDQNSRINNLDLDGDGYVDYITVSDYVDGNVHTIVMQVALGPRDKQDVGVFTVERFRDGSVQIQLIGDEALYGRNYIIEPNYDYDRPNPGYRANRYNRAYGNTYVTVSAWPLISFIFDPGYVVWRSSWYWGYYPVYWQRWTPYYYHYYYGYHHNHNHYYSYYRHVNTPRYARYNDYYYRHVRSYSPTVVVNINKGHYKNTYSRPQSRREGEATYAREHAKRSSNLSNRSAQMSNERRGTSQQATKSNTQRRSTTESMSRNNNQRSQQMTRPSTGQNRSTTEAKRSTSGSSVRSSSSASQKTQAVRQPSGNQTRNATAKPSERNSGSAPQVRSSNQNSGQRRTVSATQSNSKGSGSAKPNTSAKAPERREARSGGNATKSNGNTQAKSSENKETRSRR